MSNGRVSALRRRATVALGGAPRVDQVAASGTNPANPTTEQFKQYAADLKTYALSLKGKFDAAQIQTLVLKKAVETLASNHPQMKTSDLMDHAMAMSGVVLDGKGNIGDLKTLNGGSPVAALMDLLPEDTFAGQDLAAPHGGLRPAFDDGTANQAFHCFFFVLAGYVAGTNVGAQKLAQMGNFKHEAVDVGPSSQDYVASHMSLELGVLFSQMRDGATNTTDPSVALAMAPLVAATMSGVSDPASYQVSFNGKTYDFTQAGSDLFNYVTSRSTDINNSLSVGVVNFLNSVRDFFGIGH